VTDPQLRLNALYAARKHISHYRLSRRTCRLQAVEFRTEVAEVHKAGRMSWQTVIDEPQPLVIGLLVRDVAGLKSRHTWLPHCAPAILRANGEGSAEAAHQWDQWWDRSLSNKWNGPGQSQE
jgi:hypothetical protein